MISFSQLKAEVKEASFNTLRTDTDVYFEAVISKENLNGLVSKLEKAFGPALYPSRSKLPSDIQGAIKEFGGIMQGQTLYFCRQDKSSVFAMLWPWQDGENITLKLGVK